MKKIYINPGHSDKDPGAVGYETERRLNVAVSQYMSQYLLANYQCETKMNPGSMDSINAICSDANSWGADLFVSNHFNAGKGDGYEALVYSQKRVELGKIFAKFVKSIGQNLRSSSVADGVKIRTDLGVLKYTNMPAIINEGAFVDNQKDIQDWNDNFELQKLGEAYAKAAAEFLGLEKKKAENVYTHEQFIRDVQKAIGATVTGKADSNTLYRTISVSAKTNKEHPVVLPIQKWLTALKYVEVGTPDGVAGAKFTSAVAHFQQDNGCFVNGELNEWDKTWHKMLGMQ